VKIMFFIDISWGFKTTLIGLINSDTLVIFKFRKSKFDLKDNFVNNSKKLECSQISKFPSFKMISSSSFEKII